MMCKKDAFADPESFGLYRGQFAGSLAFKVKAKSNSAWGISGSTGLLANNFFVSSSKEIKLWVINNDISM